jgi:hypothetical protein
MALFKGLLVSKVSGSIGGLTFSHNKGGPYIRNRATPTNPGTPQQEVVRVTVGALAARWNETLTAAQRAAWDTYANNVFLTDPFGDPRKVPGISHYVRSNVPRIQAGGAYVDDAPTVYNLGEYTPPTFAADAAATEVDVTFAEGDDWVSEDNAKMLVYASRPQNPGITFFKGPYRLAGSVDGASALPPTSPVTLSLPFAVQAGNKVFYRVAVLRADGRYSLSFRNVELVS